MMKNVPENAIFFLNSKELTSHTHALAWGLPSKTLRQNSETGIALEVTFPEQYNIQAENVEFNKAVEIFLLEGELQFQDITLNARDFIQIPAGVSIPRPAASKNARFLMFFEEGNIEYKSTDTALPLIDASKWLIVRDDENPWVAGEAMKKAGRDDVPLLIKHLKNDPLSGARSHLVSVKPGVIVPWEMHPVAEEAYIIEGDYTLAECLPTGSVVGEYLQGGYFYRPKGIAHSGPKSGTKTGVTMLIRTPGPLEVILLENCPFDEQCPQ
ncbi:DUF4437 domain-containing protein [Hirschia litorea]|uniref:DUF4437 domain-containing protein n=1 Tax=Hirschia litorea TaxID=1199156 RepID=A0ABW2IPM1_9PROT